MISIDEARRVLKGPTLPDGTTVRYQRREKTYVALMAGGMWWTTGSTYPKRTASLADELAAAENIEIATRWEAL